jgi:DNA transformation protein
MLENSSFESFTLDQLEGLIEFESKRMFGGIALLYGGSAFAKIKYNKVWLKVDDSNRKDFINQGMQQYRYGRDNSRTLNFYEIPAEVLENRDEFVFWVKRSIEIIKKIHSQ